MSILCVGKNLVELSRRIVEKKKELWKQYYPNLNFDKDGRCSILNVSKINEIYIYEKICSYFSKVKIEETSLEFIKAFNMYLKEKNYNIYTNLGYTQNLTNAKEFDFSYLKTFNLFVFLSNYDTSKDNNQIKIIKIKPTKVLAEVQKYWLELVPRYNEVISTLKELRKNGENPMNSNTVRNLIEEKNKLEKHNLYFDFQKIHNLINKEKQLYLSINPLDFLTSSGDNSGTNPTKFYSCMSLAFNPFKSHIEVRNEGCYSSPKLQYVLGQAENRGIIYTKNGNLLKVPNTDFEFIGYAKRSNVWLDDIGVLSERQYPADNSLEYELIECDLDIINFNKKLSFEHTLDFSNFFNICDTNKLKTIFKMRDKFFENLYLDGVLVTEDKQLVYLPKMRKDYEDFGEGMDNPGELCSCGEIIYGYDDEVEFINGKFYCISCPKCEHCDERDNLEEIGDGTMVCQDCLKEYYQQCSHCGEWTKNNKGYEVESEFLCEDCFYDNDIVFTCEECNSYYFVKNSITVMKDNSSIKICNDCLEEYFGTCSCCENIVYNEDLEIIEGEHICLQCKEKEGA